ncbi:hypothetical protein C8Q78DRAFT_46433 [Trametes maxima]|nr:hypothetical protein C8Q78DRAFT_46433 [Trametes maxima]
MSSSSGNAASGGRSLPFDPSLLQPIVRSKRTPMACVECRRRQVKCSGTMPRCERCQKKGLECTYMSLSEQRSSTGGSISRSGTPQAAYGGAASAQTQQHPHTSRLAYQAQWAQGTQGYAAGTTYPAPQGWQAPSGQNSSTSQYTQQAGQGFNNVQVGYPQDYAQQAAYAQTQVPGAPHAGSEMYAQGYGSTAQQGYASGTTYNAYGHVVPAVDPRFAAYQTPQMGGAVSGDQQAAAYEGQFAQQVYHDPATGQMISADMTSGQQWADGTQVRGRQSFESPPSRGGLTAVYVPSVTQAYQNTGYLGPNQQ